MKPKVSNSYHTLYGGFVSLYCRHWQSKVVWYVLPQNKIGTYNKANKAFIAFEQENEREPSTEELAEILDMSETEITNIFTSNYPSHFSWMLLCMKLKMLQWVICWKVAVIRMMM